MKSHHPEYLESFVKTCMSYGLDEESTTLLLDKARHEDCINNNPEYRQGFVRVIKQAAAQGPASVLADSKEFVGPLTLDTLLNKGEFPDLNEFGVSSVNKNKSQFADVLNAINAADAKLLGKDLRPFTTNYGVSNSAILPSLGEQLLKVNEQIHKNPEAGNYTDYADLPNLLQKRTELSTLIDRAQTYRKAANLILSNKINELTNLRTRLQMGVASKDETQRYSELAQQVPNLQNFAQRIGQ